MAGDIAYSRWGPRELSTRSPHLRPGRKTPDGPTLMRSLTTQSPNSAALEVVGLIFSWTVLTAIAVILTGWLWSHLLGFHDRSDGNAARQEQDQRNRHFALFRVRLPGVLRIEITGVEVLLGFLVSIVTFTATALIGGKSAYKLFTDHWGVDPGQFNALFIFSALIGLVLSTVIFGCTRIATSLQKQHRLASEHADRIGELERLVKNLERSAKKEKNGGRK